MSFADIADVGMHIDVQPLKGNKLDLVYILQRYGDTILFLKYSEY